jgi:hypothetical protein
MARKRYIYAFEGDGKNKMLLGGKGPAACAWASQIMVPQVATVEELKRIHGYVQRLHKVVDLISAVLY